MRMLIGACAFLVIFSSGASAEYVRTKPGNEAAQAEAYCNMVARGGDRGYFAFGDPDSVAFANGMASLGNAIRRSRAKQDCMTMMGYEWVKPKRNVQGASKKTVKSGKSGNPQKWNGNRNASPERYKP